MVESSALRLNGNCWTIEYQESVILRLCIDTLFPKPTNRPSEEESGDAINILGYGLQCISPSTVVDIQVRNKLSPQENAFQVALSAALNGILPTTKKSLFEIKAKEKEFPQAKRWSDAKSGKGEMNEREGVDITNAPPVCPALFVYYKDVCPSTSRPRPSMWPVTFPAVPLRVVYTARDAL